jgi:hypothetical protein
VIANGYLRTTPAAALDLLLLLRLDLQAELLFYHPQHQETMTSPARALTSSAINLHDFTKWDLTNLPLMQLAE